MTLKLLAIGPPSHWMSMGKPVNFMEHLQLKSDC